MVSDLWSVERAAKWYSSLPWLVGCNFIPSTAINQLEMWQAETFDPATIARELKWAGNLGFNLVRVYLHDLLWWQDAAGFKDRIRHFLDLAQDNGIRTIFVLFDDCWHDAPRPGKQPEPQPGVHNSGWVKSPGTMVQNDPSGWARLQDYVTDIVSTFGSDDRVLVWDVYNEPGNNFLLSLNLPLIPRYAAILIQLGRQFIFPSKTEKLLRCAFAWARATGPQQPLSSGLWYLQENLEARLDPVVLELNDIISFHSYFNLDSTTRIVDRLKISGRPIICTEYLARSAGSNFETHLPYFKGNNIGCLNWGLVSGKTQTMYSWQDHYPSGEEPPLWFHDILRSDGAPYDPREIEFIRDMLRVNKHDRSGSK
jgi:hypothetical protein